MNLSCTSQGIKYLMFGFNLFFVLSGIIIIAVGAAVKTVYREYADFLDSQYFSLPNMLIATGAFIFMISFFGCCGAIKESWIMLGIFSICLCIIFIFEFASGIAGYVLRNKTADYLDNTLRKQLDSYNTTHDVWDLIQGTFRCCGVDSYLDWQDKFNGTYDLPISCCPAVSGSTAVFYCNSHDSSASTIAPSESSPATTTETTTVVDNNATTTNVNSTTIEPVSPENRGKRDMLGNNLIRENETTTTLIPPPTSSGPFTTGCKSAFGNYIKKHASSVFIPISDQVH